MKGGHHDWIRINPRGARAGPGGGSGLWFAFMLPTTASLTISALLAGGWV